MHFLNMLKKPVLISLFILSTLNPSAQNIRVDGYKGIWFSLGQYSVYGDKYSGGLGTYTSSHIPIAIYCKAVDKTFFVYGGTTGQLEKHLLIMISYYDHKKKGVPKPVIVYDKQGVDDPHDNASLSIDDSGYIRIFVSGRNTSRPGLIFKSTAPYLVDSFVQVSTGEMTYPQPWFIKDKGFIYLFTKYTKGRELYWTTSKPGDRWEPEHKLAGMGGHYQVSNVNNGKLVTVFNYHPGGDVNKRTNIYLLQTDDMGKSWKTIEGKPIETPVASIETAALVKNYEAEGKLVYLNDLNFDQQGNPVILAVVSKGFEPGPQSDPREWEIIHWKNGQWNFTTVCTSTHNYDMGSLYIEKNHWRIIGPTAPGPQKFGTGGEMALWESEDEGITWTNTKLLTHNSSRNHSYARRPLNAQDDFYAFWADGNADTFSASKLYYCNKQGEVWMLPYDMRTEFEKPLKLK
ncbi:MAG: hypothetical protein JWP81_2107 [Ferruginibacter sp.]|nr:hypothetical protein [Ferruginibacter sp.]